MSSVSIIIPTRNRCEYLAAALVSLSDEIRTFGGEVVVVNDGGYADVIEKLARHFGAQYLGLGPKRGVNVARNVGLAHSMGELVIFIDDDVLVRPGWLRAYLDAAEAYPEV